MSEATDHSRLTEPGPGGDVGTAFEYFRHLYPYDLAARLAGADAEVLEVGCGTGYGAHHLSKRTKSVTATDMSEEAVTYATERYPGVKYLRAEGAKLSFPGDSFDFVISFQVIEHVPDPRGWLDELRRVVKPGGRILLTTPNRRLRLLPFQKPWNPDHVVEYADAGLRRLLGEHFPRVDLRGIEASPDLMAMERSRVHPIGRVARELRRRVGWPEPGQAGELRERALSLADFKHSKDTKGCLDLLASFGKEVGKPFTW